MPHPLRTDVRGGKRNFNGLRSIRTITAAVLAALATSVSPGLLTDSASAAAAPSGFIGISDWAWPTTSESQALSADGVRTVRAGLAWDWVEHVQGKRNWGGVDKLMTDASAGGYDLLLAINGCTAWACGATRTAPQTDQARAQFQNFVGEAVRRYGANGSFWASKPSLKPARISWQVWNEVNVGADWPNPTAAGYQQMLSETSATIKSADSSARVLTSGLAEFPADNTGATLSAFLTDLEKNPAFRSSGDVVAIHGYAADPAGVVRILDTTRRIMQAAGDNRPIWITELGWGSGGPAHPFATSEATQADHFRSAFDTMIACRDRWSLERAIWFGYRDIDPAALGEADYWGMHTGLYRAGSGGGAAKPVLDAFREIASGSELPNGRASSCGLPGGADKTATTDPRNTPVGGGGSGSSVGGGSGTADGIPTVTITRSPTLVGANTSGARVDFVTSMGNSGNAQCSVNGGEWSLCATPYVIPKDREGAFTLRVRAITAGGVVSTTPATASWTVDTTAPSTVFKKTPKKIVRKTVAARFGTRAVRLGAGATETVTYQCKLNKGVWKPCGARYRARATKRGRHTLSVRAVDAAGNVDLRGAVAKFRVV